MRIKALGFILALYSLAAASLPGPVLAQEPNRAALVVQFDQDRVETRCISFEGDTVTGGELLKLSELDVTIDASRGMGITLCKVDGLGCDFPAEHCFCQCMGGGPCAYWNYFYRDSGSESWVYSPLGAALHKAGPGSVEAWVWGDGHNPPANALTFESICTVSTPTAPVQEAAVGPAPSPAQTLQEAKLEPLPTAVTPEPTPVARVQPSATPRPAASPTQTVHPAPSPTAQPVAGTHSSAASYWPFGVAVLTLVGIGAVARFRSRR